MRGVNPIGQIEQHNFVLRGKSVIVDADLARLYGVETRRLNEQFKRASHRCPADFRFQMTQQEKDAHVASCDPNFSSSVAGCDINPHLKSASRLPYVYSEHGALMAAILLRSPDAVYTSVAIVLTLVRLRAKDRALRDAIERLERTQAGVSPP